MAPADDSLATFSAVTRDWFEGAFAAPTAAQAGAWSSIAAGAHTLVVAPTGSGKTLAAFLAALDGLLTSPPPQPPAPRCRVLYISPLKALAADVERNLRGPLAGIAQAAARAGQAVHTPSVAMRSGDTSAKERRDFGRVGADILITTPESLFLLLTSAAREPFAGVTTVIIDEVHALAGSKRGAHLAVSLERLDALLPQPAQRIGLSATVRPIDEVARFLAGSTPTRPVRVVNPPSEKEFDLSVQVPVPDLAELSGVDEEGNPTAPSIWPHVEERIVDLLSDSPAGQSRSSIVFTNSRRLSERLTARLNEIWAERLELLSVAEDGAAPAQVMGASGAAKGAPALLARAHHGSVSKEQRQLIEDDLKSGRLPAVVATSSLELGIDMGAVDLVIQVEAPPSVASGLQRVGRAGHQVGAVSRAVVFPKFRGDLLTSAVAVERMRAGQIEELSLVTNPLDVAAQQIVAMVALDTWSVDDVLRLLQRTANFATLTRPVLDAVLDMLAGRYPSEDFAELRPRLIWDRTSDTLTGRAGAQRLAVTSGGTIPDRGLFGVFLAGESVDSRRGGRRVGELDEEMVYESRVGDVFTLGASSWQIVDITHDQVLVVPAPGRPGRLPFWHGDQPGRPYELGHALGQFVREVGAATPEDARARLVAAGLDEWAADNLLGYLAEQASATAVLPDDRTIVLERFRDELGDWRVVLHSPFGLGVHAPWALAIAAALRADHGVDVQAMPSDDGIVLRLPDTDLIGFDAEPAAEANDLSQSVLSALLLPAEEITERVTAELGGSAFFAARFRECAARALLLPRRRPDRRSPLWQQRQRAAQLLEVASKFPSFPIILETVRECLSDVFDVPALKSLLADLASGKLRVVEVETPSASPFAKSLLFGYVAQFLYEGDTPLAERRAAALSLDPELLAELLGTDDVTSLADLLDGDAVRATHEQLQHLSPNFHAKTVDAVEDLTRQLGPLTEAEIRARTAEDLDSTAAVAQLLAATRLIRVRVAGRDLIAAAGDAGRLRDGLGTALPIGLPTVFTELVADPIADLVLRHSRHSAAFSAESLAQRWGLGVSVVTQAAERLRRDGQLVAGNLLPEGVLDLIGPTREGQAATQYAHTQYAHTDVMRILRRRSLAALRAEVEPVPPAQLARFVPAWQNLNRPLRGIDGVLSAIEQLAGLPLPASAWETLILPARVAGYSPSLLDELTTTGEVVWVGHGRIGNDDGWVSLHPAETLAWTLRPNLEGDSADQADLSPVATEVARLLASGGGFFARDLVGPLAERLDRPQAEVAAALPQALWDLVWRGQISSDTMTGLRALSVGGRGAHRSKPAAPRARYGRGRRLRPPGRLEAVALPGGRWSSVTGGPAPDATARTAFTVEVLLDRYGVLTRGSVVAEDQPGGFALAYRVLSSMEQAGRVRRGYFVEGLGASQFASTAAVDRLRASDGGAELVHVLAATDPANVYGAALPWPTPAGGHRPARRAGALVVIRDGELLCYAERGAKTVLTFTGDEQMLAAAAAALARTIAGGGLGGLTIHTVDGEPVLGADHPFATALRENGFHLTPKGLRLRG